MKKVTVENSFKKKHLKRIETVARKAFRAINSLHKKYVGVKFNTPIPIQDAIDRASLELRELGHATEDERLRQKEAKNPTLPTPRKGATKKAGYLGTVIQKPARVRQSRKGKVKQ